MESATAKLSNLSKLFVLVSERKYLTKQHVHILYSDMLFQD